MTPRGWATTSLEEVGSWGSGGTPSRKDSSAYGGNIPWLKIADLPDGPVRSVEESITEDGLRTSAAKLVPPDTLLVAMYGSIGKLGITTEPCATNQAIAFCKPNQGIDLQYLFYLLLRERQALTNLGQGGTQLNISQTILKAHEVPIAPANEQRRIVSKIDELFSRIDEGEQALKRVEKLVERYRQSVLKAAVTGELTRDWRAARKRAGEPVESGEALLARILKARRAAWEAAELAKLKAKGKPPADDRWKQKYQESVPPDTTELPKLPEGWVWTAIGEMKSFSLYGPRFSSEDYATDGYSILRTSDISPSGRVNLATTPKLRLPPEEYAKYKVEKGDLLVTRTGSLGTLALYDDDVEAIPGAYLIQFRIPAPSTTRWYLFQFLRSPTGQRNLLKGGAGVGRPNLNAPHIESIPVPLPPLDEQAEIIRRIDEASVLCEKRLADCVEVCRRSAALRQSILKAAFSGQLVPQDPSDEPASKLLGRIAAERAAAPASRNRKKKSA